MRAVRPRSRQQPSAAKWLIGIGAATALVVVVVAGVLAVTHKMNSPEYKATVALRKATEALEAKQWDATVESCKQALEYDGRLSEASFGAGLATLHVADKDSAEESFGKLMEQAKWGDTKPFNVADAWMKDCIERCDKDLERVTVDRSLVNNKRTKACAQTYLFLTAFLRAAAAADAKQDTDTEAWLFVAEKHLKAAETTDPSCPYHKDARKEFDEVLAERKAAHSPWAAMRR